MISTAVSASIVSDQPSSQIGPWRVTPIAPGASSTQVSRVQSFTTCLSSCQASGSPVTLPSMNPTSGQPNSDDVPNTSV